MGVIYRAFDERTKRLVALKVLSAQFGSDPDYRARFAQEAELAARVEHPNIVPIYDVGGIRTSTSRCGWCPEPTSRPCCATGRCARSGSSTSPSRWPARSTRPIATRWSTGT